MPMMTEFATTRHFEHANFLSLNTTALDKRQRTNMATTNMTENISVDLHQLLTRLSDTLLSPTADDSHIRATPYERNRISAVSYCHFLLNSLSSLMSMFLLFLFYLSVRAEMSQVLNAVRRMSNTREPSSSVLNTQPKTSRPKPRKLPSKTTSPQNVTS